jgi:hypothetical protein
MSIYFYPNPIPPTASFVLRFWCDRKEAIVPTGQQDALATQHNADCHECASYGGVLVDGDHQWPQINISYGNHALIMGMLGYRGDDIDCGHADAEDFLGRLLVADALLETTDAREPSTVRGANGATLIDLGQREGYVNDKLRILIELAHWAKANGTELVWN